MSIVEIRVPSPGESITEVEIANWLKSNGDYVELDEDICEVDSDKATLGLPSDAAGTIEILVEAGIWATSFVFCNDESTHSNVGTA